MSAETYLPIFSGRLRLGVIPADLHPLMRQLAPVLPFGPGYRRGVADHVGTAVRMFSKGWDDEGRYWIAEAASAAGLVHTHVASEGA